MQRYDFLKAIAGTQGMLWRFARVGARGNGGRSDPATAT